jgi:hypothetical protein
MHRLSRVIAEEKARALDIQGFFMSPPVIRDVAQTMRKVLDKN